MRAVLEAGRRQGISDPPVSQKLLFSVEQMMNYCAMADRRLPLDELVEVAADLVDSFLVSDRSGEGIGLGSRAGWRAGIGLLGQSRGGQWQVGWHTQWPASTCPAGLRLFPDTSYPPEHGLHHARAHACSPSWFPPVTSTF